ncbi:MAG: F0F1 ATP synthase subunit alpha [Phycisphaerae bacterium]|nr:F0F1 ATP synthase subunit alpha [Phycisphaerae bacterium]
MKFRTDEIASVLREEIANFHRTMDVARVGRVLEVGDGIAQIFGLSDAMAGEMLAFDSGAMGQVFNLEDNSVGAVIYTHCEKVKAGESVRAAGNLLEVPVGEEMLGRVIDPLGNVLDGGDPISAKHARPVEAPAAGIAERQPVDEPLQTGVKAVDAMTPIGRGQRELIIGDRKTGKTAIAIDAIINQRGGDVVCVYVAIGQKESTVAGVVETLRRCGAMEHTIVVSAGSSDAAPLQYIAPYAGCALCEHFMSQGKHTLVVYDDLTKQAQAYRQISLLLRRPPGREAYPGDVFYLHSRLLERACKLAEEYVIAPTEKQRRSASENENQKTYVGPLGKKEAENDFAKLSEKERETREIQKVPTSGGSMTALPICETQEGEVSAYIPTNLISITDGQIYLEPSLFFAGVRPAINAGISVSRVGYKAAVPAMKKVAASLRLDLAAFRELESFAQLGMELDAASQRQLDRGRRMVRLLTQPQYQPMDVFDQVLSITAANAGSLDDLDLDEVPVFEKGFLAYMKGEHEDVFEELRADGKMPEDRLKRIGFIAGEYKKTQWENDRHDYRKRKYGPARDEKKPSSLPAL